MSYVPSTPSNPGYWELRLQRSESAPIGTQGSNAVIPSLSVSLLYPIFAIGVKSSSAKPNWWLGAFCDMQIFSGVRTPSQFNPLQTLEQKRIALNKLQYFQFPLLGISPYWLGISFPRWIKDVYLEVWQYTGAVTSDEPEVSLLEVQSAINRIERKIDNL